MLRVCLALNYSSKLYWFAEVKHKGYLIVLDYGLPGYHVTIHDANKDFAAGVAHARVERRKGVVRGVVTEWPSGRQLSDERGIVQPERLLPAFRDLKGVTSVSFPTPHWMVLNVDMIAGQSRELGASDWADSKVVAARPMGNAVGFDVLLVEPGNVDALTDWVEKVERNGQFGPNPVVVSSVSLFSTMEPWLAILFFSTTH